MNQMKYLSASDIFREANGAVTYSRIRNALSNGDLSGQKIGQTFVVLEDEARRWLESCHERDNQDVFPLQKRIQELEAKVVALGGVV